MEQFLKIQEHAKIKNSICSEEDSEIPTRRSLSSFLDSQNCEDKEESTVYINLRIKIPAAPLRFVKKHVHGTGNNLKNRAKSGIQRTKLSTNFPLLLPNACGSKLQDPNRGTGLKVGERSNNSNSKSKPSLKIFRYEPKSPSSLSNLNGEKVTISNKNGSGKGLEVLDPNDFERIKNVNRKSNQPHKVFGVETKLPLSFLRNLKGKKVCNKKGINDLCYISNTRSENGSKFLGSSGDGSNSSCRVSKQSPEVFSIESKSPLSCLSYLDDKNGFNDFDSIGSSDSEKYLFDLPISPSSENVFIKKSSEELNSDNESSGGKVLVEQTRTPYRFPIASSESLPDDFDAGKSCFPVKKILELATNGKGRKEELCKKRILMGGKCQPLDFAGAIHYDEHGNLLKKFPTRSKTMAPQLPPPPPSRRMERIQMGWGSWTSPPPILRVKFLG